MALSELEPGDIKNNLDLPELALVAFLGKKSKNRLYLVPEPSAPAKGGYKQQSLVSLW